MIEKTQFSVPLGYIDDAIKSLPNIDFKLSLNKPTGRFFYDAWEIKDEFKNTIWDKILQTIPQPFGEARLIQLDHGSCYMSHSDIDDRYHLNIDGQYSFLIDVDNHTMFPTVADGSWHVLNTGVRHVAANFGSVGRTQLVVRKLLNDSHLVDSASVSITPTCINPRFEFDDRISPWLHKMNKMNYLSDFKVYDNGVNFKLDNAQLKDLESFPAEMFKIVIEK
jgi:hypothetical protein